MILIALPRPTALDLDPVSVESQETCPLEKNIGRYDGNGLTFAEILEARARSRESGSCSPFLGQDDIWVPGCGGIRPYSYQNNVRIPGPQFRHLWHSLGYETFRRRAQRAVKR